MKLVLVLASVAAALLAAGGFVQFFTAPTDAAGSLRAGLALGGATASVGLLVLFCAAHTMLSRLDELLTDQAIETAAPAVTAATNPYESLTRYYFANNQPAD